MHSLDSGLYFPCMDLARSLDSRDASEDPLKFMNSFKDFWETKCSFQGSCEQIDSLQDPLSLYIPFQVFATILKVI